MKKALAILATLTVFLFSSSPVLAQEKIAGGSAVLKTNLSGLKKTDARGQKLATFLTQQNSPLAPYAEIFIQAADKYQIDWKLVPAITGVESSFGKNIPFRSYNAYGWANGAYRFQSWDQSIKHVSQVIKKKYIDQGLDNPWKIGPVYAPPSKTWAGKVVWFMNQIDEFNQENPKSFNLTI